MTHPNVSEPGKRNGLKNSEFKALNATAFTPMPIDSVNTASAVKPGRATSVRTAYFRSSQNASISAD